MSLLDPGERPDGLRDPRIVYVLRAVGSGRFKVGMTTDPARRFPRHVTDCPFPLEPLMVTWAESVFEHKLHRRLRAHRVHLEWFTESPESLAIVAAAHRDPERMERHPDDADQRQRDNERRAARLAERDEVRAWVERRMNTLDGAHRWAR